MDKKILAAALITPLMLLSNPVSSETITPSYSHATQATVVMGQGAGVNSYKTYTSNGTQTYSYNGRPSDADGDSD